MKIFKGHPSCKASDGKEERMIERYENKKIAKIWSTGNKLEHWQKVELAVIKAREELGMIPQGTHDGIKAFLQENPVSKASNISWWKERDEAIHHDLNAFLDERLRFIPQELHQYWHKAMTSYDTEEPAFSLLLLSSVIVVEMKARKMKNMLMEMAKKYKYVPMMARTHGQEAKIQSFGKRCFDWYVNVSLALTEIDRVKKLLFNSKLSGAVGNYQGLSREEEEVALKLLCLQPFPGVTQIMPRIIHMPLANALVMLVSALTQIAEDVRLAARSGNPLMQEPFGKLQKGSSAMPHKKNTITCEQQIGMLTMAKGFNSMLVDRTTTWEERAIEQSCVERIAWPDLFHVVMRSLKNMDKVCSGLRVYPDNMMKEIINSRGCYASEEAKDFLKECGSKYGLAHEDAYRIVQLASFMVHGVDMFRQSLRCKLPNSAKSAQSQMDKLREHERHQDNYDSIESVISQARLQKVADFDYSDEEIALWNKILKKIFKVKKNQKQWAKLFTIKYQLRGEKDLF